MTLSSIDFHHSNQFNCDAKALNSQIIHQCNQLNWLTSIYSTNFKLEAPAVWQHHSLHCPKRRIFRNLSSISFMKRFFKNIVGVKLGGWRGKGGVNGVCRQVLGRWNPPLLSFIDTAANTTESDLLSCVQKERPLLHTHVPSETINPINIHHRPFFFFFFFFSFFCCYYFRIYFC